MVTGSVKSEWESADLHQNMWTRKPSYTNPRPCYHLLAYKHGCNGQKSLKVHPGQKNKLSDSQNKDTQMNEQSSSLELPYVPFDIINEILSWLPVESLLRFKCVCKRLFLLIDQDNEFIAQQTVRGSYPMLRVWYYCALKKNYFYYAVRISSFLLFHLFFIPIFYKTTSIPNQEETTCLAAALSDENFTFEAICYGLCLETRVGHPQVARIRNPATRQVLCLPDAHKDTYDLSFDLNSSSGECKDVCTYIIEKQNYFGTGVGFEVLTVGKDEQWRLLKNSKQNLPEQGDEGLMLELRFVHQSDEAIHDNVLSVLVLEDYKQQIWSENKIIIPLKFLKDDSHLEDKIILSCIWFNKIRFYNSEGKQCFWYDMDTENTDVVELSWDVKSLASWKPNLVNIIRE
ncbi:hypothetical protein DVH24_023610 [Malus domestica]|uniref:F-box domain-containing protein n=1 Tax=Malus domestica TaxID=3750 RepID=A0A498I159_MALDO|nr:hypothetical protein DVH24_023610 [Malus domestica]